MRESVELLPKDLLGHATLRGNEYAWPIELIPSVISAGRDLSLLNIGGHLQLRFPDLGTCEIYEQEVNGTRALSEEMSWQEKVDRSCAEALRQYQKLKEGTDLLSEAKKVFPEQCTRHVARGGSLSEALCFVWMLSSEAEWSRLKDKRRS